MGTRSNDGRPAGRPVHLVEVGLRWPPETFLRWRFERLAAQGLRVTAAPPRGDREGSVRLSGVHLARVPGPEGSRAAVLAGAVRHALPVAARDPSLFRRLARATWRRTRGSRSRRIWETLRRLRLYLPVARLRPDVVHIEWNTTAKRYLPFIEAWRGPVVVSCHGTGIHLRPYVPPTDSEREELRASLRAATVLHCVPDWMIRGATALGMPPGAAQLIRPAVDPDEF